MAEVPKKKKGKVTKSLRDFLGADTKSNWAEETEDNFIPREPEKEKENARSSQWRTSESSAGRQVGEKPIPDSPPYTCYVGNLPYSVTKEEIAAFFPQNVKDVRLVTDKATGGFKGYGYVEFETRDELIQAVQTQNGKMLGDRQVRLDFAGSPRTIESKPGAFGRGNTIRSEGGADFGRESMGTGLVEPQERRARVGRGNGGASFGGGEFNRDQMGNVVDNQQQPTSRGFSRESMGSGVSGQPALNSRSETREAEPRRPRDPRPMPEFSREAMNSEKPDEIGERDKPGRGRGSPRIDRAAEPPPFSRENMASEQPEQSEWRDTTRREPRPEVETTSPPRRQPREIPAFSRDAMQTEQPEQYVAPAVVPVDRAQRPKRLSPPDWRGEPPTTDPKEIETQPEAGSWRSERKPEPEEQRVVQTKPPKGKSSWMQEEANQTKKEEAAKIPDRKKKEEPKKAEKKLVNKFDVLAQFDEDKPKRGKKGE